MSKKINPKVINARCVKEFYVIDEEWNKITFYKGKTYKLSLHGPAAGWPMIKNPTDGNYYDIALNEKYEDDELKYFVDDEGDIYLEVI